MHRTNLVSVDENGIGVKQDANEAAKWYTLATNQGDVSIQFYEGSYGYGSNQQFKKTYNKLENLRLTGKSSSDHFFMSAGAVLGL